MNTANWNIEAHNARQGPVFSLGAAFSVPPGLGVVEGGELPYRPEAAQKRDENRASWAKLDPEVYCYLPGVPRATYMPYPFQIFQMSDSVLFVYEYASASRVVHMNAVKPLGVDAWMGQSNGRWDGDTLVVEVSSLNDRTWFDRSGNFHSEDMKVTERYSPVDSNTIQYEATITDPNTFTRTWKMSMPLYRHTEKNFQLLEYKCVEFAEQLLYGDLRSGT